MPWAVLLLLLGAISGCRGRAYSDLYVENMAAEIRDLEDQLYEYDHEYRVLEQQLDSIRYENERLRQSAPTTGNTDHSSPGFASPSRATQPNSNPPSSPSSASPSRLNPAAPNPAPSSPSAEGVGRSLNGSPSILDRNIPSNGPSVLQDRLPEPPQAPASKTEVPSDNEFDFDELVPPSIEPGMPQPPSLPGVSHLEVQDRLPPENNLELNLSRIEVPGGSSAGPVQFASATDKVADTRVVEIAFHPSLSRATNLNSGPADDGLYLVLQPKNRQGQVVPIAADISIVALDHARSGEDARIGRWDFSAAQVKAHLQPLGAKQGIHLSLPWNTSEPAGERVEVFVRYTFPDARQVSGQKTFFVSNDNRAQAVWGPRGTDPVRPASSAQAGAQPASSRGFVSGTTASGNSQGANSAWKGVQQAANGRTDSHVSGEIGLADEHVVRPASHSAAVADPAPRP
ncbi:hypothetical protein [Aureliella helgolandensis]|uniref:hypothetical protein n=1 Tax=Aureliella helgolandensis TaxID=2527968 RepID=UPI0011A76343|nr:hypothetical protein [Aureliella helgolandensis]